MPFSLAPSEVSSLPGCPLIRPVACTGERLVTAIGFRRCWDCGIPLRDAISFASDVVLSLVLTNVGVCALLGDCGWLGVCVLTIASASVVIPVSPRESAAFSDLTVVRLTCSSLAFMICASLRWCSSSRARMRRACIGFSSNGRWLTRDVLSYLYIICVLASLSEGKCCCIVLDAGSREVLLDRFLRCLPGVCMRLQVVSKMSKPHTSTATYH